MLFTSKTDFVLKDQYSVVVYLSFQCFNLGFLQTPLLKQTLY